MENNMLSLVEAYPDLFEVKPNSFFEKDELDISDTIDLSEGNLNVHAYKYAKESIVDADNNSEAVEECVERVLDGACWYYTNYSKLDALSEKQFLSVLKTALSIYARNFCKDVFIPDLNFTKKDARLIKKYTIFDFGEGVRYAKKERIERINSSLVKNFSIADSTTSQSASR